MEELLGAGLIEAEPIDVARMRELLAHDETMTRLMERRAETAPLRRLRLAREVLARMPIRHEGPEDDPTLAAYPDLAEELSDDDGAEALVEPTDSPATVDEGEGPEADDDDQDGADVLEDARTRAYLAMAPFEVRYVLAALLAAMEPDLDAEDGWPVAAPPDWEARSHVHAQVPRSLAARCVAELVALRLIDAEPVAPDHLPDLLDGDSARIEIAMAYARERPLRRLLLRRDALKALE